jgi:hypothetical protein
MCSTFDEVVVGTLSRTKRTASRFCPSHARPAASSVAMLSTRDCLAGFGVDAARLGERLDAVHRCPPAFRLASFVAASANIFTTAAAVSGKFLAPVTVGCIGQLIRTPAGRSSGATSSMLIWSDVLIWALAEQGYLAHWDLASHSGGIPGPSGGATPGGPLNCTSRVSRAKWLVDLGFTSLLQTIC